MIPTLVRPIRFPGTSQGNLLYPLPADYRELSGDGQRQARINALCLQETPEDYVSAWSFFRNYYLKSPESHFYDQFMDSPPLHYHMIRDVALQDAAILVCPRGFAKSVIITEELSLMDVLVRPGFRIHIVKSKGDFVTDAMDKFRTQLEENPLIIEDFGGQRPKRGHGVWDYRHLRLNNHSHLFGLAIEGKARGGRTHRVVLDDVEYDPKETTDRRRLTREFVTKLTKVYIPMRRVGCAIWIIGTFLDRDLFLFHAATTQSDRRFQDDLWHRSVYGAEDEQGNSLWEEAYPTPWLRKQRILMGTAYDAEYLSRPGVPERAVFKLGKACEYDIVVPDDKDISELHDPMDCEWEVFHTEVSQKVLDQDADRVEVQKATPLCELLEGQYRFITVDYASSLSAEADYSAIQVLGLSQRNDLWSWDLWVGRRSENQLLRIIWRMARKWRVRVVGVEAVGLQQAFVHQVAADRERLIKEGIRAPAVVPIKYRTAASKETRIGRLEWRFTLGKVKLPVYRRHEWPYRELYYEIENFAPDSKTLGKDDPLDTLAMAQELIGGKDVAPNPRGIRPGETIVEMLGRGERYFPGGKIPLTTAMDINQIPRTIMERLRWEKHERDAEKFGGADFSPELPTSQEAEVIDEFLGMDTMLDEPF